MKKNLIAIILIIACHCVNAQGQMQDVVYLKNGVVLRGIIIEQVPGKTIKIQTSDGSLFVYNLSEVERMTKEEPSSNNSSVGGTGIQTARRGYLAITIGAAFPVGDDMDEFSPGLQLQLLQLGYLFTKSVGMTATWRGSSNRLEDGDEFIAIGSLMIGPMFSIPGQKFNLDIRPQIGYALVTPPAPFVSASAVSFSLGANARFHVSPKLSLLIGLDYFSTSPEFQYSSVSFEPVVSTLALSAGIAFRLK